MISVQPIFTCPYCERDIKPSIDVTGDMPVGLLPYCDCPESRAAFEREHHASVEARKNANRGGAVRSRNLVHAGRTTTQTNQRRRSR